MRQPLRGARESGARGFAKGVAKGTIGLPLKILSGVTAAASKAAEGAASDAKRATASRSDERETTLRVRQPRELAAHPASSGGAGGGGAGSSGILMPYPKSFAMD